MLADSGFVRVFVGDHSIAGDPVCALDAEGGLRCWGVEPSDPVSDVLPQALGSFSAAPYRAGAEVAVSWGDVWLGSSVVGDDGGAALVGDVCGVRTAGGVECWAWSDQGVLDEPVGEFAQVAAGARHGCALAVDGSVRCWGNNEAGQRGPTLLGPFEWLLGELRCERGESGPVQCRRWATGELISPSDPSHPYGEAAGGGVDPLAGPFSDVWVTDGGSCALGADGELVCWGNLGAGFDPAQGPFVDIAAGRLHACGLKPDATVACWRQMDESLLDASPSSLHSDVEALRRYYSRNWAAQDQPPEGEFTQIAAGELHTCALDKSGEARCWGNLEGHGEAPNGPFTQLTAAGTMTCALSADGETVCWGRTGSATVAPLMPFDKPATAIVATVDAVRPCVIGADGGVRCSFLNDKGTPRWVPPLADLSVAGPEVCGISLLDRSAVCWHAHHGNLTNLRSGDYSQISRSYDPARYVGLSCTLARDGAIACDTYGLQAKVRGEDYASYTTEIFKSAPDGEFSRIDAASEHGCAIATGGTIACWGYGASYQIDV